MRIITDLFAWATTEVPEWNTISISGYHIREAGSTAVQEVAFTFANAIAYIESAVAAGLDVDSFAPRLSFFFNAHSDFLTEVAKFRAARRLYTRLMRDRFHAKSERSCMLRFHTQTAGSNLTAQQPDVNVVRTTLEALSAVLGGTQSLHTNARDEALGLPTEQSAQLALRTQQILAEESGVAHTVDPLGGSYHVESLTTAIEQQARAYLNRIDAMGGMVAAIERDWVQREIEDAAFRHQQAFDSGESVVVGVNRFAGLDATEPRGPLECTVEQDQIERLQIERVKALRTRRDPLRWRTALDRVTEQARCSTNLMPAMIEAVESCATVGEIASGMGEVFRRIPTGFAVNHRIFTARAASKARVTSEMLDWSIMAILARHVPANPWARNAVLVLKARKR